MVTQGNNTDATALEIGRVLWEARLRYAWGKHAESLIARQPWPKHLASPDIAEAHLLAIEEAKVLLRTFKVEPRPE